MEEELENIKWDLLSEEGIFKEDLGLVDLDIAFSPVIACKGDFPREVIETIGGKFLLVNHPLFSSALTKDELTVMRYRYLINRSPRT